MKKAIIIIVSVIVILGGVFASLFFFTDVFNFLKPANTNFALQAKKLLGTENGNNYSDYEKFLNICYNKIRRSKLNRCSQMREQKGINI